MSIKIKHWGLVGLLALSVSCGTDDEETTTTATTAADETDTSSDNFTLNGAGEGVASLLQSTPAEASLSIYQFAVSESEDCSNPTVVIDNGDTPAEFDMLSSPEIGTGTIPDGTYPCVVLVMAPSLSVTPATTEGSCTAGQAISQNVCSGGGDSEGQTINLDGELVGCGESTDKAYLYLSTGSTLTNAVQNTDACDWENPRACSSWEPPTAEDSNLGVPLRAALVVSGTEIGVFKLGDLAVGEEGDENDPSCGMGRPTFTFVSGE